MANVELSVIIPSKNNHDLIPKMLRRIAEELGEIEAEFIVIDMNSADDSVILTLEEIKRLALRGCVIQSGGSTISSALNTGMYKSDGRYITFAYPSRQYKNYLKEYLALGAQTDAELIFAAPARVGQEQPEKAEAETMSAEELLRGLIYSRVSFDFTAVMLRREFLLQHHVRFQEECTFGYVEAFIYHTLIEEPRIACSNKSPERIETAVKEGSLENVNCYERIDAMCKVYELLRMQRRDNRSMTELFEHEKLPAVVMSVVDILKKEGFSDSAIKKTLKQKGYVSLLKTSGKTSPELRRKVFLWKFFPWRYQTSS